jgi:hypothetical protein
MTCWKWEKILWICWRWLKRSFCSLLPIVPLMTRKFASRRLGLDEPEPSEDEVTRSNPFSVLAQLKRDPNV